MEALLRTKPLQPEWILNELASVRKIAQVLEMPGLCFPPTQEPDFSKAKGAMC